MVVLDTTVVNVALPSAQHDLGFGTDERQWVVTVHALAFTFLAGATVLLLLLRSGRIAPGDSVPAAV